MFNGMAIKWLLALDLCSIFLSVAIVLYTWLWLPREVFLQGFLLAIFTLALAVYLTQQKVLAIVLQARRRACRRAASRAKRVWLTGVDYLPVIATLGTLGMSLLYLPYELLGWGILLAFLVLFLGIFANAVKISLDYADLQKTGLC